MRWQYIIKAPCAVCQMEYIPQQADQKYCCKKCAKIARQAYMKEYLRQYNKTAKSKASHRKYYQANQEKVKAKQHEHYLARIARDPDYYKRRNKKTNQNT